MRSFTHSMIKQVNKGDNLTAQHTNSIVDAVNNMIPNTGAGLSLTSGLGGFTVSVNPDVKNEGSNNYENAFHLGFEESAISGIKTYVLASYIILDNKVIIPTLDDQPICEETPSEDFEPPKKDLTNQEYEFWLEIDKLEYTAKIWIDKKENIDQSASVNPALTEWRQYGKFTVTNGVLESYIPYIKHGINEAKPTNYCWKPRFYKNSSDNWKFKISKGYAISVNDGNVIEVNDATEFTPSAGDKYYCRVETDENGKVSIAEIEKTTNPQITQHDSEQGYTGIYYYLLFEVKEANAIFYAGQAQHSAIFFHSRGLKNIGGETNLLTAFNSNSNRNEIKSLKAKDPDAISGETEDAQTTITIVDNGSTVEIGATTKIPKQTATTGATGTITFLKDSAPVASITVVDGLVTALDAGDLEICCDTSTTIPA